MVTRDPQRRRGVLLQRFAFERSEPKQPQLSERPHQAMRDDDSFDARVRSNRSLCVPVHRTAAHRTGAGSCGDRKCVSRKRRDSSHRKCVTSRVAFLTALLDTFSLHTAAVEKSGALFTLVGTVDRVA